MKISARFNKRIKRESVIASRDVLDVIIKMLREDVDSDVKAMRARDNLESPNYTALVADHLATQRTLDKVIKLIEVRP